MAESEVIRDSAGSLGAITPALQDRIDNRRALMFSDATPLSLSLVACSLEEMPMIGGFLLPKYGVG